MEARDQVVALAEAEKGYLEKSKANWALYGVNCLYAKEKFAGADNVTKYSWETGHYNKYGWAAWCQSFVNWVLMASLGADAANKLLCGMYKSASTMDVKSAMVKAGREVPIGKAEPGDLVFRQRSGGGHVGIVKGWQDGKIVTIEGNSSSTDISSWNGGAVVEHVGASWNWCCRPDWSVVQKKEEWHWLLVDGVWYYQNQDGQNKHGWHDIKESQGDKIHRYYFNKKGQLLTGAQMIDDVLYCFMPAGPLEGAMCVSDGQGQQTVFDVM